MNPFLIFGIVMGVTVTLFFTLLWLMTHDEDKGFFALIFAVFTVLLIFEGSDQWEKQHKPIKNEPILQTPVDANRAK